MPAEKFFFKLMEAGGKHMMEIHPDMENNPDMEEMVRRDMMKEEMS